MEKVKVVKLLDKKSGVSQKSGKPWQSREVYLESVQNVMRPEKYLARLFGDAEGESHVLLADASSAMRQLDKLSHLTLILMRLPSIEVALLRTYQGDGAAYSASLGQEVLTHLVRNL